MGQGASTGGQSELRHNGSTKRQAKHRRSTRSLPDATLIRTTPSACHNGGRPLLTIDQANMPCLTNSSSIPGQQQVSNRRVGVSASASVDSCNSGIPSGQASNDQRIRQQEAVMKQYLHRDAAPYYVSTKPKPVGTSSGARSFDMSFNRPWGDKSHKYKKSTPKTRYNETPASSNWSDVASDMFRITKHHESMESAGIDCSVSDIHSDFVSASNGDRHIHRHNRGSSKRCQQQKKVRRSEKYWQDQSLPLENNQRQPRRDGGEPDGDSSSGRRHVREYGGLTMTPVPENPYRERQDFKASQEEPEENVDRYRDQFGVNGVAKRSKSVHDCAVPKRAPLQPPSHPPPRPPKGKVHYYARLENGECPQKKGDVVEHWIDFPRSQRNLPNGIEVSPDVSASTDQSTPRSPGSSECDKLVIQSLRAELSAERSLRADAERRCKNYDKETELHRQQIGQLESDVERLTEMMDDMKTQRQEDATMSKKKIEELTEKCQQFSDELRRSAEEKHQTELRCQQEKSSYDEYMDSVANKVGQALARQETMNKECARLQKRVLEVEWENKVLKAQLRLTSTWASGNVTDTASCFGTNSVASGSTVPTTLGRGKVDSSQFSSSSFADHQNGNQTGVVYRRKSFREKMAGLHKYRQSMGSDPTLDQSGAANTADMNAISIESLASFNEENDFCAGPVPLPVGQYAFDRSCLRPYQQPPPFPALSAGEGLCSRPGSLNFDSTHQDNRCNNAQSAYQFSNGGESGQVATGGTKSGFTAAYSFTNANDDPDDYEEPVKNYAAMFGEARFLCPLPATTSRTVATSSAAPSILSSAPPIFNTSQNQSSITTDGIMDHTNDNHTNSSTETLNAGTAHSPVPVENRNNFCGGSPRRKLDVVVNMLTRLDIRQPSILNILAGKRTRKETSMKTDQMMDYWITGLVRDDGYSTMSSEAYAAFDSNHQSKLTNGSDENGDSRKTESVSTLQLVFSGRITKSVSDGQLNDVQGLLQQKISKRNGPSLNFDALERDYATLLYKSQEEDDGTTEINREALCDVDMEFRVPMSKRFETCNVQNHQASNNSNYDSSLDQLPPDPSGPTSFVQPISIEKSTLEREQQRPVGKRRISQSTTNRLSSSSSTSDSSVTGYNGANDTPVSSTRCTRTAANASTSSTSTSFTSDDDEDSRVRIDEGAKSTMLLWLKQLKIKRAGQKSGLVRYLPPGIRPSILRSGVFARFGMEERRALACFDFLYQFEEPETRNVGKKGRSRSVTDLYENLPYHERTGTLTMTNQNGAKGASYHSKGSLWACDSSSTLNSVAIHGQGLGRISSFSSSLFLSDFCMDDTGSTSTSNSSLSFTIS